MLETTIIFSIFCSKRYSFVVGIGKGHSRAVSLANVTHDNIVIINHFVYYSFIKRHLLILLFQERGLFNVLCLLLDYHFEMVS